MGSMDDRRYPRRLDRLPWREIDGRTVIIHPQAGEVHEINPVGTLLWSAADGTRTLEELAGDVADVFDVDADGALADTREFFAELDRHRLVQWSASPGAARG